MFPKSFGFSYNPTAPEFLDMIVMTERSTIVLMAALIALVIYNVRNYMANPTMCVFVSPMMLVMSVASFQMLVLAGISVPNDYKSWLIGSVGAAMIGASIGILVVAVTGQVVEAFSRSRARRDMPEFADPGPNRVRSPTAGAGQ
jgi:cation transport ATPase